MTQAKTLQIPVARILSPLLVPSRYKAIYGGRGALKSHFFSTLACKYALEKPGFRMVCLREVKNSLDFSSKLVIQDKIRELGLSGFRILKDRIETPNDGFIIFKGLQDFNVNTIKSFEDFDVAWNEESEDMSPLSLEKLRPTFRKKTAEIWFSWNPRNVEDPVDKLFRGISPPKRSIIVRTCYTDNPWYNETCLEEERQHDLLNQKDRYGHIWLGDYEPAVIGALWNRQILHNNRREVPQKIEGYPKFIRVIVAVDPAVTDTINSDEHGIIVIGLGEDQRGYVVEDLSLKGSPTLWASQVVAAYDRWDADSIVVEVNQGGDHLRHTLETIRPELPIEEVRATRETQGKHVRALPIASLYTLGRISHIGTYRELEDQMCKMTRNGYKGTDSPDRLDALVWGFSKLFPRMREEIEAVKEIPIPSLKRLSRRCQTIH